VQELNLTAPSEPVLSVPSFPKKRLIFVLVSFFVTAIFLIISFLLFEFYFSPSGKLQVTTASGAGRVFIDDQVAGQVAFSKDLRPGKYKLRVEDPEHQVHPWEGEVSISSSALTTVNLDLGPSSDFSSASVLAVSRGNRLAIFSNPTEAKIYLDGTVLGDSPYNGALPAAGVHSLKLSQSGMLDKKIDINITSGWGLSVSVNLYKNPQTPITVVEKLDIKPAVATDLSIIKRSQTGLDKMFGVKISSDYTNWTSAELLDLGTDDKSLTSDPTNWLKGLYYDSVYHLRLPDLPFHYIVDSKGVVYEARSGGYGAVSVDVSAGWSAVESSPTSKPGVLQVGYLGPKGGPTKEALAGFHSMVAWLGQPPLLSAQVTSEKTLTLDAGKRIDLNVFALNNGIAVWSNSGDQKINLTTVGRESLFITSGVWLDSQHPTTSQENFTVPGAKAMFKLSLTAPSFGGDFNEAFNLMQGQRAVAGSGFNILIHVNGPARQVQKVQINATPTGFLRVRSSPGTGSTEVGRVNPGDQLELVSEQSGWYQIKMNNGQLGWVSSQYATKI